MVHDDLEGQVLRVSSEGRGSGQHLVQDTAHGPQITRLGGLPLSRQHLWRHVVRRPDEAGARAVRVLRVDDGGRPEVGDLYVSRPTEEDVCGGVVCVPISKER